MASICDSYISCGINQLYDMYGDGENTVRTMHDRYIRHPHLKTAFVLFSHVVDGYENMGEKHAKYIEENGIGSVTRGPVARNPNSGNNIQLYLVLLNLEGLRAFGKKKGWIA